VISEGSSSATVVVVNPSGLHARPCHALVSLALKHGADLSISYGGRTVNGKSILELMTLNAAQGAELTLQAAGDGKDALLVEMAELFANGFGELQH
jgi:phosphotransferase system HPr (HPr) family protein